MDGVHAHQKPITVPDHEVRRSISKIVDIDQSISPLGGLIGAARRREHADRCAYARVTRREAYRLREILFLVLLS